MSESSSTRTALLLSVIMPGLGQFLQKRWVAAAIYAVLFNLFALVFLYRVLHMLYDNMKASIQMASGDINATLTPMKPAAIIVPLVLSLAVYVAGLVDTAVAGRPRPPV